MYFYLKMQALSNCNGYYTIYREKYKNKKKTTINLLYKDWHYPDK